MSSSKNHAGDASPRPEPIDQTVDFSGSESDVGSAPKSHDGVTSFLGDTQSKEFGDFTLVDEIARGGMGVVYRALDNRLSRQVALKMILSGRFASENDVRRFYQEAESAANLDHPGIVPIYEIGEHEGHHYFSMKLIEGGLFPEQVQAKFFSCAGLLCHRIGK